MDYEEQQDALIALRDARKYVQQAHDDAELKHSSYGDFYMDGAQYEVMIATDELLARIATALRHLEQPGAS